PNTSYYQIGNQGTFTWTSNAGPHDNITGWRISIGTTPSGNNVANNVSVNGTSYQFTGTPGQTYYATLTAVSAAGVNSTSSASDSGAPNPNSATTPVKLLAANADDDADGQTNEAEHAAGTNPLSSASSFKVNSAAMIAPGEFSLNWASVAGKKYRVQRSATLAPGSWADISPEITATGATSSYNDTAAGTEKHFYRVRVVP
ncbi:MAG: hypothetical protein JNG86_08360, partial [Verrucomicrobiaceae bacterium]|nr:hypothetical protein [Verrucomicrobiaceae bacterium]